MTTLYIQKIKYSPLWTFLWQCAAFTFGVLIFTLFSRFFSYGIPVPNNVNPLYATLNIYRFSLFTLFPFIFFICLIVLIKYLLENLNDVNNFSILMPIVFLSFLFNITVAMMHGGPGAIIEPLKRSTEYYADIDKVENMMHFIRNYAQLMSSLSLHGRVHPPGAIITLRLISNLVNDNINLTSLAIIAISTFTVVPVYLIAKSLYSKEVGFFSLILMALSPNYILFTATSMNAFFSFLGAWTIFFFFKLQQQNDNKCKYLLSLFVGLWLALSTFFTFDQVFIGFFMMVTILLYLKENKSLTNIYSGILIFIGFICFYLFLYIVLGFNVFEIYKKAYGFYEIDVAEMISIYGKKTSSSWYWFFGNPIAFFLMIGIPIAILYFREIKYNILAMTNNKKTDKFLVASIITLIAVNYPGLYKGEVERIWMFINPLVVIGAASYIFKLTKGYSLYIVVYGSIIILFFQTFLFSQILDTHW